MTRAPLENKSDWPDWAIDAAYLFGKLLTQAVLLAAILGGAIVILRAIGLV